MLPHRPESRSEILRAARILHVRVEAARIGDYQPVSPRFQARDVDLDVTLVAVLKGDVPESPGDRLEARVTQTENIGARITAVPGAWSRLEVDPGSEFLVFAQEERGSGREALVEPACFRVLPADFAAEDVALAAEAGLPELRLADLLARHQGREARFGLLFAGYLVARLPEVFPDHDADLRAVLRVLETPELAASTRFALCSGAVGKFALLRPVAIELMRPFVQNLFRLLAMPEAKGLHGNLVASWIPNLVGVLGGLPKQRAGDIFPSAADRAQAASRLQGFAGNEPARLIAWLGS